jgi:hypothetical protein
MNAFRWALFGLSASALLACETDLEWRDTNRPDSFGDLCDVDAGACAEPFQCILDPSAQGNVCTASCFGR